MDLNSKQYLKLLLKKYPFVERKKICKIIILVLSRKTLFENKPISETYNF